MKSVQSDGNNIVHIDLLSTLRIKVIISYSRGLITGRSFKKVKAKGIITRSRYIKVDVS